MPFEVRNYLGNKVIYAGCHNLYDETHMDGSYEKGDFLTYYFYSKKLIGVAASPSRIRDLQVLREGLRVEIRPTFK